MKLRVAIDGEQRLFDPASYPDAVKQVMPGVFSVLLNNRSYQVNVSIRGDAFEVWVGVQRFCILIADPRDRASNGQKTLTAGPVEVRAQMPGKIIKLLIEVGADVTAGQGLIVVEAMKMQNEVKAPKDGKLTRMYVSKGSIVGAGDPLLIVE